MLLEHPHLDEHALVTSLGRLLRAGVVAAAGVVMMGAGCYFRQQGALKTDYRVFRGEPAALRSIHGIFTEAVAGSGRGLIQLGLLVLIATPVVRVFWSVIGFARERDWVYVTITVTVLTLLAYSFLFA